jgi:spore coat polysaccharide biosynthesis protein SpsF
MKIATIVQARMGSTRLPGKVLLDLGGMTVLARVVNRLRRAKLVGEIIIATTSDPADDAIVDECHRLSVESFRGEELDVLDRYYRAAQRAKAEAVVRVTSDCPMIEPEVTDLVISTFIEQRPDYASNARQRTYPRGLDTEIMTAAALARCWDEAKLDYQRVHVTPYIYENPTEFRIVSVTGEPDYSQYRWTVDTPEDLAFLRAVYQHFGNDDGFYWRDAIKLMEEQPAIVELNRHITMKALHEG